MATRTWTTLALFASVSLGLTAGCGAPPKPPPPPPSEDKTWEETKTVSAPKKCEALDEKCAATASTKARIAKSSLAIVPLSGWTYAQGENATVAQSSDTGAAMVVVGYETANAKEDIKNREAALDAAAKEIGVVLPAKKKVAWKTPIDTKEAGSIKIPMFELEGAKRKDKAGILLVFAAVLPENKGIVGFGFVPADEKEEETNKIVEGLQTSIGSVTPQEEKPADGKK